MNWRRIPLLALIVAGLPLAVACSSRSRGAAGGVTAPPPVSGLRLEAVSTALTFPVLLVSPPADTARLFIVEKGGVVRIIKSGVLLATPFLDIHGLVSSAEEQGLLGLAFEPAYAASGRFIVSYTDVAGNTKIARYHASGNPDVANPTADGILLSETQPQDNHNGGMIAFGPDGLLWIGLGDGGGGNDTYGNGQSKDDLLGSMLRIDVSGASGYSIPAGNPYTSPDRPELWNIGLRNPWRWSFDRLTGDLWIADVGQSTREEIDVAWAANGRSPGANYGWPIMEGSVCRPPTTGCNPAGLTLPVYDYDNAAPDCAVTGGYVYRGTVLTGLEGTYFYADYCGHVVRSFRVVNGTVTEAASWPALDPGAAVTSFGEDTRGELYVLTATGGVYRIVPQ